MLKKDDAIEKALRLISNNFNEDRQQKDMKEFISSLYDDFYKDLKAFTTPSLYCVTLYKNNKFLYLYKNRSSFTNELDLAAFFFEDEVISFLKENASVFKGQDISNIVVQKVFLHPAYAVSKR